MRWFIGILLSSVAFVQPLQAQAPSSSGTVGHEEVDSRSIAKSLAARLESDFVYPGQGARYAAALRASAEAGTYDAIKGVELAKKLGEDLQAVAPDAHLGVAYRRGLGASGGPQIVVRRPPEGAGEGPAAAREPVVVRFAPPAEREHAGWIAPGIAYIRFNLFSGEPEAVEAARAFMATHLDAKAIIFDLRTHFGGGLAEMDTIFPFLFAEPTRLVTMAARKSVDESGRSPIGDGPTLRLVEADPNFVTREHWTTPGKEKRLRKAKIYVLTSGLTASAAEHFALAFKHTKRGTLIGQTTYGAGHFGGDQDLGGGYSAFIPVGRSYDPVTGKDWEGGGVSPDIEVPAEDALIEALTREGVSRPEAAALSARVAPKLPLSRPPSRADR